MIAEPVETERMQGFIRGASVAGLFPRFRACCVVALTYRKNTRLPGEGGKDSTGLHHVLRSDVLRQGNVAGSRLLVRQANELGNLFAASAGWDISGIYKHCEKPRSRTIPDPLPSRFSSFGGFL